MKNLVLAEKPSVGKELGRVLGCVKTGNYLENENYVVTWALGHLVTLCPPDWYGNDYKHWTLRNLPMLPEKLETMVIDKTKDQYELVKSLLDRDDVDTVIIATDAGREGELVARWILNQANCRKPIKRLWISSQTDLAIRQGFENLKDGHEYDSLFAAAESRSFADWYVGYNVSRAMSCHFDTRLSAGRVQTPTLALITGREDEIESFTGKFYWTLKADFGSFKASWYSEDGTIRINDEDTANKLYESLKGATGKVVSVTEVPKTEKPPLAYDLTELQRDANTVLGFSAKETLDTLQRLYEIHKIVTYPRTDSRYITDDIVPTFKQRLEALEATPFGATADSFIKSGIRDDLSRLVNNEMVSDHHALLPTEQRVDLSKLSNEERALWELIMIRFLEVLSPDYQYSTTTVEIMVNEQRFIARLTVPSKLGYRSVAMRMGRRSTAAADSEDEGERGLAELKEGSEVTINEILMRRNATLPPDRYTEADLLYAMEHAGKFVEDAELRKRLENGLGTPATRADIIEKLINSNCIVRDGKYLVPTPKGRELVRLVPPQLKSPELTGQWEKRLYEISNGREDEKAFVQDIKKNAADLVKQVIASLEGFDPNLMGSEKHLCPSCSWPMVKVEDEFGVVHYVCQRFSCGYEEKHLKKMIGDKIMVAKVTVKESHYRPRTPGFNRDNSSRDNFHRDNSPSRSFADRSYDKRYEHKSSSEGGTFADFIKASQERQKQREERKRK